MKITKQKKIQDFFLFLFFEKVFGLFEKTNTI